MDSLPFFSLLGFFLSRCHMGYSSGQLGSAVLAMSPPKTLHTPQHCWGEDVGETALMLCQYFSAVAKTQMCYQHLSSYQYRTHHWEGCCGENDFHLSQTQYSDTSCVNSFLYLNYSQNKLLCSSRFVSGMRRLLTKIENCKG